MDQNIRHCIKTCFEYKLSISKGSSTQSAYASTFLVVWWLFYLWKNVWYYIWYRRLYLLRSRLLLVFIRESLRKDSYWGIFPKWVCRQAFDSCPLRFVDKRSVRSTRIIVFFVNFSWLIVYARHPMDQRVLILHRVFSQLRSRTMGRFFVSWTVTRLRTVTDSLFR